MPANPPHIVRPSMFVVDVLVPFSIQVQAATPEEAAKDAQATARAAVQAKPEALPGLTPDVDSVAWIQVQPNDDGLVGYELRVGGAVRAGLLRAKVV